MFGTGRQTIKQINLHTIPCQKHLDRKLWSVNECVCFSCYIPSEEETRRRRKKFLILPKHSILMFFSKISWFSLFQCFSGSKTSLKYF